MRRTPLDAALSANSKCMFHMCTFRRYGDFAPCRKVRHDQSKLLAQTGNGKHHWEGDQIRIEMKNFLLTYSKQLSRVIKITIQFFFKFLATTIHYGMHAGG